MKWETVEITKPRRKSEAFVSVGRSSIIFSGGACCLIKGYPKYGYAQIMRGQKDGKKVLGIRFLENNEKNSLVVNKRKDKGEPIAYSGSLHSKPVMEELFGIIGTQNKVTNYPAGLDDEEDNVLIIYLEN